MIKQIILIVADAILRVERAGDGPAKKQEAAQIIKQQLARIRNLPIPLFMIDLLLPYAIDWIVILFNRIGALNGDLARTTNLGPADPQN